MARYMYVRDVITSDEIWTAPEAKNQEFDVRLWGGGGAGSLSSFDPVMGAGGGSGYFAQGNFIINPNEKVDVTIGMGGKGCSGTTATAFANAYIGESGGTTMFGQYLSAAGGQGGQYGIGGIGGCNGGAPGVDGEGNFAGYGIIGDVNGTMYVSGGGGAGPHGRGPGGAANMAAGDASTAGGGAGALITAIDSAGIHRRTGSGGQGVVHICYYRKLGD